MYDLIAIELKLSVKAALGKLIYRKLKSLVR